MIRFVYKIDDEFLEKQTRNEPSPELRLWAAVLKQAVFDLTHPVPRWEQDAYNWITSDVVATSSFVGICLMLGAEPSKVRLWILGERR